MEWFYKYFHFDILLLYGNMQCNFDLQRLSIPFPYYEAQTKVRRFFIYASRSDRGKRKKLNLNFYLHTVLWCLKRFYEGL